LHTYFSIFRRLPPKNTILNIWSWQ
jgi:hypothetical protein